MNSGRKKSQMSQLPVAHVPKNIKKKKKNGLSDCNTTCRIDSVVEALILASKQIIFCRLLGGGQHRKPHTSPVLRRQWETILSEPWRGDMKAMGNGLTVASHRFPIRSCSRKVTTCSARTYLNYSSSLCLHASTCIQCHHSTITETVT